MQEFQDGGTRRTIGSIGVLTIPLNKSGIAPLRNLIDVLCEISPDVRLVTGNSGYDAFADDRRITISAIRARGGGTKLDKILRNAASQLRLCYHMVRNSRRLRTWVLFMGAETQVLPVILARVIRRKTVLVLSGSYMKTQEALGSPLSHLVGISTGITCSLSDRIVLYSRNHVSEWGLERHAHKIVIAHRHFLDLAKFRMAQDIEDRSNTIGYVGRLSKEKGVLELVNAVALIVRGKNDVKLLIAGEGPLLEDIRRTINTSGLEDRVRLLGWIPHDELPELLRSLKLLVLPSYTEGLPNTMLEAMASGTPVIATSVGGIPDYITHGRTGFILEDAHPNTVAEGIVDALESDDLLEIAHHAREIVETDFSFKEATERWRTLLAEMD